MNAEKKHSIRLLERFESISARADRFYRRTGLKYYADMRADADKHAADLRAKLRKGSHVND